MEPIKQEIISCIYENGENLITGPVLQEVLLDMVDDTNAKVASGSVPGDLVEKTGSWDDAADWVEDNSGSLVHDTDLDGYATEQWVEDQGYLKEVPEGYATTESLNELSESVAELSSSIPSVDLSGYATTESVNEATQSVKDWVEAKHYLTTASLSGSVTEESVQFMINDSTASMKEWVENQNYATETYVSESIANLDIPDTSGFVTTQSYNQDSASFDERINSISGSDLSGYATTESLNLLSESVAEDLEGKADRSDLPDLTGYATEQWVQEQGYLTEHQDISGLATTESLNQVSSSLSESIAAISASGGVDLSGYATTESLNAVSESVSALSQSVRGLGNQVNGFGEDLDTLNGTVAGLASTSSLNSLSESVATDIDSLEGSIGDLEQDIADRVDWDTYDTEKSEFSQSVASDIASLSESIAAITGSDLSGYVTTASYNADSASFDQRINAIVIPDLSEYATTSSVNSISESLSQSIAAITGSDLSGYATTESVNNLSSSINTTFKLYATTQSVTQLSQSISQSISQITGSAPDLSGYVTTASLLDTGSADNPLFKALHQVGMANYWEGPDIWTIELPQEGEGSLFAEGSPYPGLLRQLIESGIFRYHEEDDGQGNISWWIDLDGLAQSDNPDNTVGRLLGGLGLADWDDNEEQWYSREPDYFTEASASFDQRINSITGSGGSGEDAGLRSFLFGNLTQNLTSLSGSAANIYSEINTNVTLGFSALPDDGKSIGITVHNTAASESIVSLPDSVTVDGVTYNLINNGVDNSGSVGIPAGEYGDIVVTRKGTDLFLRTSIDLGSISGSAPDLSGYATTASLNELSESVNELSSSIPSVDLSGYATTASLNEFSSSVGVLSASFDQRIGEIIIPDVSGYATTAGVNSLSASFDQRINNTTGSGIWVQGEDGTGAEEVGNSSYGNWTIPYSDTYWHLSRSYAVSGGIALGANTSASGWFSVAEGERSMASGRGAHAEGYNTTASGHYGHAEGLATTATGSAHAEGKWARALGNASHAEGDSTNALGNWSHAEGSGSQTWGSGSHAEGFRCTSSNDFEHSSGKYNALAPSQIFSIGVGHFSENRKNAISVITGSGNVPSASIYLYGVGSYNGANPTPGTNDIATIIANLEARIAALESGSNA